MKVNLEYAKPVSDRYGLCTVICPGFPARAPSAGRGKC